MDIKAKKLFRVLIASIIIGGSTYVSVRYLMKGSPMIKVLVLLSLAFIIYLTVDKVFKLNKKDRYGE
jgi:hypothetical protein